LHVAVQTEGYQLLLLASIVYLCPYFFLHTPLLFLMVDSINFLQGCSTMLRFQFRVKLVDQQ